MPRGISAVLYGAKDGAFMFTSCAFIIRINSDLFQMISHYGRCWRYVYICRRACLISHEWNSCLQIQLAPCTSRLDHTLQFWHQSWQDACTRAYCPARPIAPQGSCKPFGVLSWKLDRIYPLASSLRVNLSPINQLKSESHHGIIPPLKIHL